MDLSIMNEPQKQGVTTTEGPVLILAGAGSGKTRVLTHRVAYLIEQGVSPANIMAITFTNKAAAEMRERIDNLVDFGADSVWVATFHSSCVRILRRFGERLGYDRNFTIYDTDDCKSLMKEVCGYLQIDTKKIKEKTLLNAISDAKNELVGPEEFASRAGNNYNTQRQAQVYREYQSRLKANNAMDFDDLIMNTVSLLKYDTEVLKVYQDKFHYIMVDEYQDTNTAQFELVRLLASGRENLCVVGDDDQSIYKFRGANIYNILHFEQHYPNATVIKLEQNYRSSSNILTAANGVIANNKGRKVKALWTEAEDGSKLRFEQFDSAYEESSFVALDINALVSKGLATYRDCAILYRTNAQSRVLEEKLIYEGIPYKIVGGINFYSRKEIKDLIAYLKTVDNGKDDIAVQRIINIPKRGIGATSVSKLMEFARSNNMNFYDVLEISDEVAAISAGTAKKISPFVELIDSLKEIASHGPVTPVLEEILEATGYMAELQAEDTDEAKARIENIEELMNKCITYDQETDEPSLSGFLEEVALVADIDSLSDTEDYVVLMTLHGAKGLEFPRVYMVGMEDGLFPSYNAIMDDDNSANSELEEERRLCYVGITRAKEVLTMTAARMRMVRGEMQYGKISRFVKEIPSEVITGNLWEPKPRDDFSSLSFSGEYASSSVRSQATSAASRYKSIASSATNGTKIEKKPLDYTIGDRVMHIKFREGTVLDIIDEGRDYEVTVEFDSAGVRKLFASFAKLQKI